VARASTHAHPWARTRRPHPCDGGPAEVNASTATRTSRAAGLPGRRRGFRSAARALGACAPHGCSALRGWPAMLAERKSTLPQQPASDARPPHYPTAHEPRNRVFVSPPNDLQISCRPSSPRPQKLTLPLFGLWEARARAELWPAPACRLHLRVRPHTRTGLGVKDPARHRQLASVLRTSRTGARVLAAHEVQRPP
jgi:hypothetical protein